MDHGDDPDAKCRPSRRRHHWPWNASSRCYSMVLSQAESPRAACMRMIAYQSVHGHLSKRRRASETPLRSSNGGQCPRQLLPAPLAQEVSGSSCSPCAALSDSQPVLVRADRICPFSGHWWPQITRPTPPLPAARPGIAPCRPFRQHAYTMLCLSTSVGGANCICTCQTAGTHSAQKPLCRPRTAWQRSLNSVQQRITADTCDCCERTIARFRAAELCGMTRPSEVWYVFTSSSLTQLMSEKAHRGVAQ